MFYLFSCIFSLSVLEYNYLVFLFYFFLDICLAFTRCECVGVILFLCCVPILFCLDITWLDMVDAAFLTIFSVQSGVSVSLFAASVCKKMAAAVRGKTQHEVRRDSILRTRLSRVYLKYVFFLNFFLKSCSESFFIWNLFLFPLYVFLKICTSLIRAFLFKLMMKKVSSQYDLLIYQ